MVARLSLKTLQPKKLYLDRLPRTNKKALLYCSQLRFVSQAGWYLAGGTALALQVGHRQSMDLDFFTTQKNFDRLALERNLFNTGHWQTSFQQKGTLYGTLMRGKMSFIAYPFFKPSTQRVKIGHIRMLSTADVAAMKIVAISQRGRKRDFVDLFWYCQNQEPLGEVIYRAVRQYPGQRHNLPHILKSLTYFDDAEDDVMPELYFQTSWRVIKAYFKKLVPQLAKTMLGFPKQNVHKH